MNCELSPKSLLVLFHYQTYMPYMHIYFVHYHYHHFSYTFFAKCTITPFTKKDLLMLFLFSFRWFWKFCGSVIFISAYKHWQGVRSVRRFSKTPRTRFFFFLYYTSETFFCRIIGTSTKNSRCLEKKITIYTRTWTAVDISIVSL